MRLVYGALAAMIVSATAYAQSLQPPQTLPRLINVTGVFQPADGHKPARVEMVTLAIYTDETGGVPLWQEAQSVDVDSTGHYSLLLGASAADGVPLDVFTSGEARWLGMLWARAGEVEGPRARLTSVPYAIRASNADTLGGRPASAYQLAPTASGEAASSAQAETPSATIAPSAVNPGVTNFLAKYVNANDVGTSTVFDSGGLIGINTSTPFDVLHARFTNTNGTLTGLAVQNLGSTASSFSGMLFYDQNGALGQFQGFNNVTHEYRINNIAANGTINFMTDSASRFFVSHTGDVGIGTTSPRGSLEAERDGTGANLFITGHHNFPTVSGGSFIGSRSRGTAAAPSAVLSGDVITTVQGAAYGATGFSNAAFFTMSAAENWTDTAHGTNMRFSTAGIGAIAILTRMSILADGNVGIAVTTPVDKLHVAGDIRVGTGTTGCVKDADATVIAGTCVSDARFKKDITPFGPMLRSLAALQPVHYYWRAAEFPERHFGSGRAYGLIAQDVEQVLPELVVSDEDGYKAVNYSKLPLLTIQAVKELKTENDAVKRRVDELNAENAALKRRVAEIDSVKDRVAELERLLQKLLTTAPRQ